ncbi:MAG: type II toxin-antitoxin system VapC family toxin [Burkholderiaceae bacterium]
MYILDTNVLSELMRPAPKPSVLQWIDNQAAQHLFSSAITKAEIELGIALLPAGKRRDDLASQAEAMFNEDFENRCLPFDQDCAHIYANLVAVRTRLGLPVSVEDAQIAAICVVNQKTLVTRNTADFVQIDGLQVLNPWDA